MNTKRTWHHQMLLISIKKRIYCDAIYDFYIYNSATNCHRFLHFTWRKKNIK